MLKNTIESLKEKILKEEDKILFEEVLGTYNSKFYRASYIISWINIIESLKSKIKELSILNDSRALNAIQLIDSAENNKQSTDKIIFEQSKTCDIISATDFSTINYLWEQRCIFAHPYNLKPTKDQLEYIITQSVELVLSKQVTFNKEYIDEFCNSIISKPYLISSDINKINELSQNTIKRLKENLHPYYFKTLFYHYGINQNTNKDIEIQKIEILIKDLFTNTSIPLQNTNWSLEDKALKFPYQFIVCIINTKIWNELSDRTKDILINYYNCLTEIDKVNRISDIFKNLVISNSFNKEYLTKYFNKLDSLVFNNSIYYYGKTDKQFERIIEELKTWQFGKQDAVIQFINNEFGKGVISNFNAEQSFELGRVIFASARSGHWKSTDVINSIYNEQSSLSKEIYAGVALANFLNLNDELEFNSEKNHLAVKILNDLDNDLVEKVYLKIFNYFEINKPKSDYEIMSFGVNTINSLIDRVNKLNFDISQNNQFYLNSLKQKVEKYFA